MQHQPVSVLVPGPMAPRRPVREFEPLSAWQNGWRLVLVWVLGVGFFAAYFGPVFAQVEGTDPDAALPWMLVDLLVGQLIVVLAAFRRRSPLLLALLTMALTTVSAFGAPAAFLAAMSLSTRRRLVPVVYVGAVSLLASLVAETAIAPQFLPEPYQGMATGQGPLTDLSLGVGIATLVYAVVVLIGWNVGSRRELTRSWRRQAETANREQSARVAQAQLAERARIAREMHDVLAHRLSLVAMHAGVLVHRPDLSERERAEAAETVRSCAHEALEELREVLGVLRADGDEDATVGVEAPQPDLSGIPSLVAEVTSSGQEVRLVADERLWPRSFSLPASTGRHAYRVVQEALTNARRHAPGEPVTVEIGGAPGEGLSILVRNKMAPAPVPDGTLPSGGRGLTGMAERVQLAGGRFEAGAEVTHFVVRVWLPWPRQRGNDD